MLTFQFLTSELITNTVSLSHFAFPKYRENAFGLAISLTNLDLKIFNPSSKNSTQNSAPFTNPDFNYILFTFIHCINFITHINDLVVAEFDNSNRMTKFKGQAVTYDADGNRINDERLKFSWGGLRKLTAIEEVNGTKKWQFMYDEKGRRIEKVGPNGTIRFVSFPLRR